MPKNPITKEMKRILVLGVCALFVACNSSSENSSDNDTSTSAIIDTPVVTSQPADTITTESIIKSSEPVVTESKVAEVKVKIAPSEKVIKAVEPEKPAVVEAKVDTKKGEALISKSDCFACHKINEKLLGPSYKDVANKYANTKANVNYLVAKIKNGGSGVWGAIPMSPHPALSDDDAAAMVQYILSLN
jgi:cytochrome c